MSGLRPDSPADAPARPSTGLVLAIVAFAIAAIPVAALMARESGGSTRPYMVAETGRSYSSLQQAIDAVGNARATIRVAPGSYRECAVQSQGVITYQALEPGTAIFDGVACEGKAALVLRGSGAEVRGLTFRGIRVRDGNGAGIRLEKGSLNVAYTRFEDSQQGILAGRIPGAEIAITRSTFSGLGTCENSAGCAHSVYVGDIDSLTVKESRFEQGRGGHYLKSRASRVAIEDNSFDDANGTATNYMIDLPAGATGTIAGNWFVQGRDKENHSAFIALGAEKQLHPSNGLVVARNEARFVPGLRRSSAFLADWTGSKVVMHGNRLADGLEQYQSR